MVLSNKNIGITGSGNVATVLGIAFKDSGFNVSGVYSRNKSTGNILAKRLACEFYTSKNQLCINSDLVLFAVSDDSLPGLLSEMDISDKICIHTSGSTSIDVFEGKCRNYGVLYPLQTLHKDKEISLGNVPVFIEGSDFSTLEVLRKLASGISDHVVEMTSEQRLAMHVSAVFVNNFVTRLYDAGFELLKESGISFEYLLPLILETANKAVQGKPADSITGPAARNDQRIIEKHKEFLRSFPEYNELYIFMTESILKMRKS